MADKNDTKVEAIGLSEVLGRHVVVRPRAVSRAILGRTMRRTFTAMMFLGALLVASPDVDGRTPSFSRRELRGLLDAVLATPWEHVEGGLASYRCVKENAYEGSRLLVDVEIDSGAAEMERPLRPGNAVGPYQQYRPAKREGSVIFVLVTFTKVFPAEVRFSAGLTGLEYDQHGKVKDGTIGIGCGASHEGLLIKSEGRWRKAVQKSIEPADQSPEAPARR